MSVFVYELTAPVGIPPKALDVAHEILMDLAMIHFDPDATWDYWREVEGRGDFAATSIDGHYVMIGGALAVSVDEGDPGFAVTIRLDDDQEVTVKTVEGGSWVLSFCRHYFTDYDDSRPIVVTDPETGEPV